MRKLFVLVVGCVALAGLATPAGAATTKMKVNCVTQLGGTTLATSTGKYHVTLKVPKTATVGSTLTATLTINIVIPQTANTGAATLNGGPDMVPQTVILGSNDGYVFANPGASSITGSMAFTVGGKPGDVVHWSTDGFGWLFSNSAGDSGMMTCTPRLGTTLGKTRIV
jgi:hypothetical protein